jgi:RND family efflux transporter MFP subunit
MRKVDRARWQRWGPVLLPLAAACHGEPATDHLAASAARPNGQVIEIVETTTPAVLEVAGIARSMQQATLSTRLAGTVLSVRAQEGQAVMEGQVIARIDSRDLLARREQARAGMAEAEAVVVDARLQAARFRSLYAESAAPKVQLDAAETGLTRAEAGQRMAQASFTEVEAMASYAEIRAPFAGRVTRRLVDPGDFVSPGVPIVEVEDQARLRIVATLAPGVAAGLRTGMAVDALIEGVPASAKIEGIVPAGNSLLQVNAIVDNRPGRYQSGGAASLLLPQGNRQSIMVPLRAIVQQGDLTGVRVATGSGLDLRWVRLGITRGGVIEVLSGLRAGDRVFVPDSAEARR